MVESIRAIAFPNMSKTLPNSDLALVEKEKIIAYLLNQEKMPAAAKARFFFSFGFSKDTWEIMARSLKEHARSNPVVSMETSAFGTKFVVKGTLKTPDDRNPVIVSVWQSDKDALAPRLITAYPASI